MKYLNHFISLSIIILLGFHFYHEAQTDVGIVQFMSKYDHFDSHEKLNDSPLVFQVSKDNRKIGYLVFEEEQGYQSTIVIALLLDYEGNIIDAKTYFEDETPAFYTRIEENDFLSHSFTDKNVSSGFKIGVNVDAISGATISSQAIVKAVHDGGRFAGKHYLDLEVVDLYKGIKFGQVEMSLVVILVLVFTAQMTKWKKLRTVILLYSIILLGFNFSLFITYSTIFTVFTGQWPTVLYNLHWYLLVFGSLGITLLFGKNLYCYYMCPFGAFQELEYELAKIDIIKVPRRFKKILYLFPPLLAYITLVLALLSHKVKALNYEPFSLLYGRMGEDIQWVLLPVILFASLFIFRFYCNYGCPVGYVLNLILKIRAKIKQLWSTLSQRWVGNSV